METIKVSGEAAPFELPRCVLIFSSILLHAEIRTHLETKRDTSFHTFILASADYLTNGPKGLEIARSFLRRPSGVCIRWIRKRWKRQKGCYSLCMHVIDDVIGRLVVEYGEPEVLIVGRVNEHFTDATTCYHRCWARGKVSLDTCADLWIGDAASPRGRCARCRVYEHDTG